MVEQQAVQITSPVEALQEVEVTKDDVLQLALNMGIIQSLVSRTGKPYIRMAPYTYKSPTMNQLKNQLRFAEAAILQRDITGTVRREDGTQIPVACERIAAIIKATPRTVTPKPGVEDTKFEEIYQKVREHLGVG